MLAINQLCAERKLSREVVLEALEASLVSAYKRNFGSAANIEVHIEPNTGEARVFAMKEVSETVSDRKTQISLEEARLVDPAVQFGGTVPIESTPRDFGRIAAQAAKQVLLQRMREAERDALYTSFADRAGEIAHGTIQSVDLHSGDVVISVDGAEALLSSKEQVPTEKYRRGGRLRAYVLDVRRGSRGPQITLSRRSPNLLRRLLELEVPEIFNGSVEVKAIAREAGSRSKVAVHATQEGVDPVGSCVGVRGGRIQNIVNELGGEKIDIVQWNSDMATFIANSLSPAKVMNVLLDDNSVGKTATVIVPDRQLSLAIGKDGQNARLAAKLTGWRIDIKSATEAAEETLGRLEDLKIAPQEMDLLSLAEAYLQRGDGFSKEEQALIEATVTTEGEEVHWPAEEPVLEVQVRGEGEEKEAIALAGPEAEAATIAPVAEEEARPAGPRERVEVELSAMGLPFEGEPVEDSLGWAKPQPAEEYTLPWSVETEAGELEVEWIRDDLEEDEEEKEFKAKGKKKKKEKGGKRVPSYKDTFGMNDLRSRKPPRPR